MTIKKVILNMATEVSIENVTEKVVKIKNKISEKINI